MVSCFLESCAPPTQAPAQLKNTRATPGSLVGSEAVGCGDYYRDPFPHCQSAPGREGFTEAIQA